MWINFRVLSFNVIGLSGMIVFSIFKPSMWLFLGFAFFGALFMLGVYWGLQRLSHRFQSHQFHSGLAKK